MECQILFSEKNKKNIISLLCAENAQRSSGKVKESRKGFVGKNCQKWSQGKLLSLYQKEKCSSYL